MTNQEQHIQAELFYLIVHYESLLELGNLPKWEAEELKGLIDVLEHIYNYPSSMVFPEGLKSMARRLEQLILSYTEKIRVSSFTTDIEKYSGYLSIDQRVLEQINRILSGLPLSYSKNSRCLVVYK